MESRAKSFGHPIHPMLIVFPLGLLATAVVFDVIHLVTDRPGFAIAAAYSIAAGVIGGLVAAIFGLIDWIAIPAGTRAKRVGAVHGIGNVVVVALFAVSWLLRSGEEAWDASGVALVLGFVGAALSVATGWLGGELVYRLKVGVDDDADLDAPNSLSRAPAATGGRREVAR